MKISSAKADSFFESMDSKVRAVLFYGPDPGLVSERARKLTTAVLGDYNDPFCLTEMSNDSVKANTSLLLDEAATFSMTGGRRVVRVRSGSDGITKGISEFISNSISDTLVVVDSDNLGPRSTLRQLFESAALAAAVPCYMDDSSSLSALISTLLKSSDMTINKPAMKWLVQRLGVNRANTEQEVLKLITYKLGKDGKNISLDDVVFCIADSSALDLEDLVFNMASGDQPGLLMRYARLISTGTTPISILNASSRHLMRLYEVKGRLDNMSTDAAIGQLKPPVFFKRRQQFELQVAKWGVSSLTRGLEVFLEAELQAKKTHSLSKVLVQHALIRVANAAKKPISASRKP